MAIDIGLLADELKIDEGFRECVYTCSAGKLTLGYGHNIEDNPLPEPIAEKLLHSDIAQALAKCERFDWFFELDGVRQRVIVNMVFNIGFNGVSKFKKMIAAIEAGLYGAASIEMMDSKWANQVGARALRLSQMMCNG